MTYLELIRNGENLSESDCDDQLRQLMQSPAAAALVSMIRGMHDAYARDVAQRNLIGTPGSHTHLAGSMYALQLLEKELEGYLPAKKKKKGKPPVQVV